MADVRKFLRRSEAIVGIVHDLRKMRLTVTQRYRRHRSKRIRDYLEANKTRKLQLGSGPTSLPGWLCTDFAPTSRAVMSLDVTRPFPFDDSVFDYVFCEHLIEHVSWSEGRRMLQESYRVLKPGGTIRIATPDLAVFLDLCNSPGIPRKEQYTKWITDTYLASLDVYRPQFVINDVFYNWGHRFLYDGEILGLAVRKAGFENIVRCEYGESLHPPLRGIESHGKNVCSTEMTIYETMIYEATRPG